ncbi:hypothetical protein VTK26DRAFT_3064 [Humicola hyalothermophila]
MAGDRPAVCTTASMWPAAEAAAAKARTEAKSATSTMGHGPTCQAIGLTGLRSPVSTPGTEPGPAGPGFRQGHDR